MTALAPTDSRRRTLEAQLADEKPALSVLLPEGMEWNRFARLAVNAAMASPKLLAGDRGSFMMALLNCAALGLEPNTPLHEAVIIPRGNAAVLQIEYRGLIELARASGSVRRLTAATVRKGDVFNFQRGAHPDLKHIPTWPPTGEPVAYYAYAEVDGDPVFEVMTKEEVEAHRDRYSDAYKKAVAEKKTDTPWIEEFDRMAEKTVLHKLERWLPKRVRMALQVDAAYESGGRAEVTQGGEIRVLTATEAGIDDDIEQSMGDAEVIDVTPTPAEPDPRAEKLAQRREELRESREPAKQEAPPTEDEGGEVEIIKQGMSDSERTLAVNAPGDAPVGGLDEHGYVKVSGEVRNIVTFPLRTRTSRSKAAVTCEACKEEIVPGESYYDAGPQCRVHEHCGVELSQLVLGGDATPEPAAKPETPPPAPQATPKDPAAELLTGAEIAKRVGIPVEELAGIYREHGDSLPSHMVPRPDGSGERLMFEPSAVDKIKAIVVASREAAKAAEKEEPAEDFPPTNAPRLTAEQQLAIMKAATAPGGAGMDWLLSKIHTQSPSWNTLDDVPEGLYEKVLGWAKKEE